jgi:hypothetical protein
MGDCPRPLQAAALRTTENRVNNARQGLERQKAQSMKALRLWREWSVVKESVSVHGGEDDPEICFGIIPRPPGG